MIDLYTWTTPNGYKISILLEELGLPYRALPVNLGDDEQHRPDFLAMNPNAKIPVLVDHDAEGGALTVFESGAILIYLAEKTGRFLPEEPHARARTMQWLMFQMSQVGQILGQLNHFINQAPEQVPYAIQRFMNESVRIIEVLDTVLADSEYLAGEYSIADMATYPWVAAAWKPFAAMMPDKVAAMTGLQRWLDRLAARPAVARGMAVPASTASPDL